MTPPHRITRAAYLESLADFREFIREHCAALPGISDEILYDVQLAVDEACTNIISHGYADMDPGSIILDLEIHPEKLTDAPIEERELGGFGLFFIQQSVDEMEYHVTEDGNTMTLTKYLRKPDGGQK
jgi:serine/threonine-protein kinase RsbW